MTPALAEQASPVGDALRDLAPRREVRPRGVRRRAVALPLVAVLAASLSGCIAGTTSSSDPIYPATWPRRVTSGSPGTLADLTGRYRAVSDPAPLLQYPSGGRPQDWVVIGVIPGGGPEPDPHLGRRVLPWHLAGAFPEDGDRWDGLLRLAAALDPDGDHPDGRDDAGWVCLSRTAAGDVEVRAGVTEEVLVSFVIRPGPEPSAWQAFWSLPKCSMRADGALAVTGAFLRSPVETASGLTELAAGTFTFYRAEDGSLVMLESLHYSASAEVVFAKWWRWRPVS